MGMWEHTSKTIVLGFVLTMVLQILLVKLNFQKNTHTTNHILILLKHDFVISATFPRNVTIYALKRNILLILQENTGFRPQNH